MFSSSKGFRKVTSFHREAIKSMPCGCNPSKVHHKLIIKGYITSFSLSISCFILSQTSVAVRSLFFHSSRIWESTLLSSVCMLITVQGSNAVFNCSSRHWFFVFSSSFSLMSVSISACRWKIRRMKNVQHHWVFSNEMQYLGKITP